MVGLRPSCRALLIARLGCRRSDVSQSLLQLQAVPAAVRRRGASAPLPPRAAAAGVPPLGAPPADVSEVARQNLKKAAIACRRYGWISFWVQLVLNTVAAIVLLFSLAFTSQVGTAEDVSNAMPHLQHVATCGTLRHATRHHALTWHHAFVPFPQPVDATAAPPLLLLCRMGPPSRSTSPCSASCWASSPSSGPLATCGCPASCAHFWRQRPAQQTLCPRSAAPTSSPC